MKTIIDILKALLYSALSYGLLYISPNLPDDIGIAGLIGLLYGFLDEIINQIRLLKN